MNITKGPMRLAGYPRAQLVQVRPDGSELALVPMEDPEDLFADMPCDVSPGEWDLMTERDALRFRMAKALDALSAIQARGVLQAHGHDDLNEALEAAIGALVGRKD